MPLLGREPLATTVALGVMPAGFAVAAVVAPHLSVREALAPLACFAGAAGLGVAALLVASAGAASKVAFLAIDGVAVAALVAVGTTRGFSVPLAGVVDTALVALAWGIGTPIGRRVQHPGHLLPACVVAACADVVSVVSPHGPTHAIAASDRALSLMALSFPVPGTRDVTPTLGLGDLVFVALVLGVASAHGLPRVRIAALALAGAFVAMLGSAALEAPVPALPAIGAAVVLGVRRARVLDKKDRNVAAVAVVVAVTLAALTIASRLGWLPGSAPGSVG